MSRRLLLSPFVKLLRAHHFTTMKRCELLTGDGAWRTVLGSVTPQASGLGSGYVANEKFSSSTGVVLEVETFALSPKVGIKIRGVSEKYKSQDIPGRELDGSHIGVIGVYYFR